MLNKAITTWKNNGKHLTINKISVYIQEIGNPLAGANKTLLLIHGFPESSFSYHLVIDKLSDYFDRIILFDLPGFGLSDKPKSGYSYSLFQQTDITLEVWKKLNITGGHLLAHDMGDSVATELVARSVENNLPSWFSDGFKSLTFTNGSMILELAELRILQKLLLSKIGKYIAPFASFSMFKNQIKSAHGNSQLNDIEIQRLWEIHSHNGGKEITYLTIKYLLDRKKYEKTRWLPALSKTNVPIHICWGEKDNVAQVSIAHQLKKDVCPKAHLTIMKDAGHFCQLGCPEEWTKSVLKFYRQL